MNVGRKCEFDKNKALHEAMLTFWEKGYLGASLSELTTRMGINKPSMYAAFGNKEKLFLSSIDYYLEHFGQSHSKLLDDKRLALRDRLINFLHSVVKMQFDKSLPKGCLVSQCVADSPSGSLPDEAVTKLDFIQNSTEEFICNFFETAKNNGELNKEFNSQVSANLIGLLIHGTAVMAKSGKRFEDVEASIGLAVDGLALA